MATANKGKMVARLFTNKEVSGMVEALRKASFKVDRDNLAGTITVLAPNKEQTLVFKALQKGRVGSPWIVRLMDNLFI